MTSERPGGAAPVSGEQGSHQGHHAVYQQPGGERQRRHGDIRHNAVRPMRRFVHLLRDDGVDGGVPPRRRGAGEEEGPPQLAHHDPPAPGGGQGQAANIKIQAKEILFISEVLNMYIAEYCGQPKDKIEADCDRDFFMTAEEAVDYGIIDEMIQTKTSHITKPPMPIL